MEARKFWEGMEKIPVLQLLDKFLIGRNATGQTMYADINQIRVLLAAFMTGQLIPQVVEPGATIGRPDENILLYAGPGTYIVSTNPAESVTTTANLSMLIWDKSSWSKLEIPVNVDVMGIIKTQTSPIQLESPVNFLGGGNVDYLNRVYSTKEAANSAILNELDSKGVNKRSGKSVQIIPPGGLYPTEHRWLGGFEDYNLKEAFADNSLFQKIYSLINTDEDGNINFVDTDKNIGFQFTADGVFRAVYIDVKSIKINGQDLDLSLFAKEAPFLEVKGIAERLDQSFDITTDGGFRLIDEAGFIGLKFLNGLLETFKVKAETLSIKSSEFTNDSSEYIWVIRDDTESLNMAIYLDKNGLLGVRSIKTKDLEVENLKVTGTFSFPAGTKIGGSSRRQVSYGDGGDYIYLGSAGQSNARGEGGSVNVTTDQLGLLMPNSGLDSEPASNYSDFIPYVASTETPLPGIVSMFKILLEGRSKIIWDKKEFQIIGGLPSLGGATIQQISKGTATYNKLIGQIAGNIKIATSKGKTLTIPFIPFTQGESNSTTDYTIYLNLLIQLIEDINTDIRAINPNQVNIVPFIGYQMNGNWYNESNGVSKVHADLGINDQRYICACPSYFFEYAREGANKDIVIHFTPSFRRIYGAYIGIAAFSLLYENKKFLPLHPIKLTVTGNNIQIKYHVPKGFLVLDTTTMPDPGNYGFRIVKNNTDLLLSNIKILPDGETVSIDCSESPAGSLLLYARNKLAPVYNIDDNKAFFGARGCLRDTQGDTLKIDNYPLHNWALATYLNI